jgi:drug/metabolite transporter (DMT)-like permease
VDRRAQALFATVVVLWGVPFALIAAALDHGAEPLHVAWARVAIGAAVLLPIAWRRGALRGLGRHAGALLIVAICDVAGPFTLLTLGEQRITSSLAGILIASTPLFVAGLAPLLGADERPSGRAWAGLGVGFAGVVALVGIDLGGDALAAALVLLAAFGYAIATLVVRRLDDVSPLGISTAAMTIATVLLLPGAVAQLPATGDGGAWAAIAALGVACTAAAFAAYYALIARVGATRAALTTYLAPIVSVATGAAALGEHVGPTALAGLALILLGSWLTGRATA